jgi:hypothetical protein
MKGNLFFFQISAKNKGISQYGGFVPFLVRTQEKGENNASVMCLIYMYLFLRECGEMPTDSLINGIPMMFTVTAE